MQGLAWHGTDRSVFNVCSHDATLGDIMAIIQVRALAPTNESRNTCPAMTIIIY
jgi:hypothetical protein